MKILCDLKWKQGLKYFTKGMEIWYFTHKYVSIKFTINIGVSIILGQPRIGGGEPEEGKGLRPAMDWDGLMMMMLRNIIWYHYLSYLCT